MSNDEKAKQDWHEKTKTVSYEDKRRYVRIARTMRAKGKKWPEIEKKLKRSWRWIYKLVKEDDERIAAAKTSELRSDAGFKGAQAKWTKEGKAVLKADRKKKRKADYKIKKKEEARIEPEEEKPLNYVGYVRVSTEEQAKHGLSLDSQERRIKGWVAAKDWNLLRIYRDEGYSAKSLKRPALQELLEEIEDNSIIDGVIVFKLDRFSRSLKDLLDVIYGKFAKADVAFTSVMESFDTSTPAGRAMLAVLGTFSQFERETTGERVSTIKQDQKQRGEFVGTGTIAYKRVGNKLVEIPEGMKIIETMIKEWQKGTSARAIGRMTKTNKTFAKRIGERWKSIEEYKAYYEQWRSSCKRPENG